MLQYSLPFFTTTCKMTFVCPAFTPKRDKPELVEQGAGLTTARLGPGIGLVTA